MSAKYDADYFIAKFKAIPDEKWCTGKYHSDDKSCAYGHCGADDDVETAEAKALESIFENTGDYVSMINDGFALNFRQPTPKARILAALREIKALEDRK